MGNQIGDHDTSIRTSIRIMEDEVLELKQQKLDLLARLRLLQDTISRKCVLVRKLENSLVPVNRLPNEILITCFGQAVQDWVDNNDEADKRVVELPFWRRLKSDFSLPCTPVLALSHISHHWRQLAINTPSLWTSLVITPKFRRHLNVFRIFLHRAKGMPIAANFRSFASKQKELNSAEISLMEAIMPLIHSQQINALTFLASGPVLSFLLSQTTEQIIIGPPSPPSIAFSRLTALSIFSPYHQEMFMFSHLKRLLSAAPQLKTLELHHASLLDDAEHADNTVVVLPMLENLTLLASTLFLCKLLDSLSAPNVRQLKLLPWDNWELEGIDVTSCLFINNNNHFDSRVPRFPRVQNLTLSFICSHDRLDPNLIRAFPRVTHLTLGSPALRYEIEESESLALPTLQCLQHLTLDFAFEGDEDVDLRGCFAWLPKPKDHMDRPLLISVFDRSTKSDKHLFRSYQELQQYGELDGSSSRLDEYMCWQAGGKPAITG